MRFTRIVSAVLFGILLPTLSSADPLPIEAYAKDPEIAQIDISPDGSRIAYMRSVPDGSFLIVTNLDTGESQKLDVSGIKARRIHWSGPNHVLLYVSETHRVWPGSRHHDEEFGVFSINIHGGKVKMLLKPNKNIAFGRGFGFVPAVGWQDDGSVFMPAVVPLQKIQLVGTRMMKFRYRFDLMKVNGDTGYGEIFSKGGMNTWDWIVTPAGRIVARVDYESKMNDLRILVPGEKTGAGVSWRTIFHQKTENPEVGSVGLSAEKDALIVSGRFGGDRYGLHRMSLSDGTIEGVVFEHPDVDVESAIVDPYQGVVIGADLTLDATEQRFFDAGFQQVLDVARRAIPHQRIHLTSWDRANNRFILFSEGPGNAGSYYLFDVAKRNLMQLAQRYPEITSEHVSTVTPLRYTTRDGLEIPAYLTVPSDAGTGNLPLIALPHGGPEGRDRLGFDDWAQAFASRGYAVLQMNFRGSSGYGQSFVEKGYGEWGGKMQDDITDGVRYLVEQGIADPKRICIVGASYGGYAALAGATFTPDLYRCAVSIGGVSDLGKMMHWVRDRTGSRGVAYEYWEQFIGVDRGASSKVLHERSPAEFADRVKAGVLLIHGEDDTVVDIKQSKIMHKALKKAGKDVSFVTLKGEDHWLSVESTRVETLKAMEEFLAKHLRPTPEAL